MEITLADIVEYLNQAQVRCTYSAVADVLGTNTQVVTGWLQTRSPEYSWIVCARSGRPDGYLESELHPRLYLNERVIRSGDALRDSIWMFRNSLVTD